jgi:hypothetical protein
MLLERDKLGVTLVVTGDDGNWNVVTSSRPTVGSAERSTDFPIDFCPIVSAGPKARGQK